MRALPRTPAPPAPPAPPHPRTISRWVDEAKEPEAVVLPLGGHGQLLHRGACLGAARAGVRATPQGGGRRAAPARATHVRKQREVQVPPQVAHSAPAPVLEHVQVHLPLVLRGGGAYSPYSGPSPRPPRRRPAQLTSSRHGGAWWVRLRGGGLPAPPGNSVCRSRPSGYRRETDQGQS